MPLPKVTIASAGSGKTHDLIENALSLSGKVLIVTYTEQNLSEIRKKIVALRGTVPPTIHLLSWYGFLLKHCVRPYQHPLYSTRRIERPYFGGTPEQDQAIRDRRYVGKSNVDRYYIVDGNQIVGEFASDFAVQCNSLNNGAVISRLEEIYEAIFIDEVQDLAGYDLVLLELLFGSRLRIEVVGDCRQVTYKTNTVSNKYSKYRKEAIVEFFMRLEGKGLCEIVYKTSSRRCCQSICDFADRIFSELPPTQSLNSQTTGHDGVFLITPDRIENYVEVFSPQVLRWNRQTKTCSTRAINFGESKGLTFNRVLIYPTAPIRAFLKTGALERTFDRAKFYVAVTRAQSSVGLVYDGELHTTFADLSKY